MFLILFFLTLFAELIANDRPLIARYQGEILFPALVDYPKSKFGGFLAVTDYRDPVILEEIEAKGWMLWPPIRYSYDTINKDYPNRVDAEGRCYIERDGVKQQGGLGYPAPPQWAAKAALCDAAPDQMKRYLAVGNWNWLGLDNQGRDVLARVIYGFRISVLFGLLGDHPLELSIGVRRVPSGFFGGRVDLLGQRLVEIWGEVAVLYMLIIIVAVRRAGVLDAACSCCLPSRWTAGSVCCASRRVSTRAQVSGTYVAAAVALGRVRCVDHVPSRPAECVTLVDAHLHAVRAVGVDHLAVSLDFLGLGLPAPHGLVGRALLQGRNGDLRRRRGVSASARCS